MRRRIYIFYLLLLSFTSVFGQSPMSYRTYYVHQQVCYYIGTQEIDYLLHFKNDSTVLYTIYSSDYKNMYPTVLKETYEGMYTIKGDTLSVLLTSYNSNRNRLGVTGTRQVPEKRPIAIHKSINYIISDKRIDALSSLFPSLMLSQYSIYLDLSTKFEDWKNKEVLGNRELGHSK